MTMTDTITVYAKPQKMICDMILIFYFYFSPQALWVRLSPIRDESKMGLALQMSQRKNCNDSDLLLK